MITKRIIARLDVKGPNLVKGIHLEGLRIIGNPNEYAKKYENQGADELIFIDSVASLYGRDNLNEIVKKTTKNIFIPLTVGGGIRTLEDIRVLLNSGADKVAINTGAIKNPEFLKEAATRFGSQCIVLSVQAKKRNGYWEAYTENGREASGLNIIDWIKKAIDLGIGEVLLTSIDREGTKKGFDLELINEVEKICTVPLIICGGAGKEKDLEEIFNHNIDGVALAAILHYDISTIDKIKKNLEKNYLIRPVNNKLANHLVT